MKKTLLALAVAAAFAPTLALAEAGDIVVRVRAAHINPSEDSSLGRFTSKNVAPAPGVFAAGAELAVDSNTIPEIDFSYYITKNIAVELILATGTKHDVSVTKSAGVGIGNQNLGEVNLLPPTLTVQWHFMPDQMFDPYVGAGINVTKFMDNSLATTKGLVGLPIRIDHHSFGGAIQAGFDVNLKDGWLINADLKKVWIDTDVELNAGAGYVKIDELDIDPWVFGIGFGKKF